MDNKVLGKVYTVTAWLRPIITPEDWVVVRLGDGRPAYVETKSLK